jgi:hypothetical protein
VEWVVLVGLLSKVNLFMIKCRTSLSHRHHHDHEHVLILLMFDRIRSRTMHAHYRYLLVPVQTNSQTAVDQLYGLVYALNKNCE